MNSYSPSVAAGRRQGGAHPFLRGAVTYWFVLAVCGQWLFTYYLIRAFAIPAVVGDTRSLQAMQMITGYVPGDGPGNAALLAHVFFAALVSAMGLAQFVPGLRRRLPALHRWNGRVFLLAGLAGAISGLWLTWGRGSRLSDLQALGTSFNGLGILVAAPIAWRLAKLRRFAEHARWAVRAWLLVSGVWTFRLMLMGWFVFHGGPVGNSPNLDGPADVTLSFASYLFPLAVAELYFIADRNPQDAWRWVTGGVLVGASTLMAFGIFAAYLGLWRSHM